MKKPSVTYAAPTRAGNFCTLKNVQNGKRTAADGKAKDYCTVVLW